MFTLRSSCLPVLGFVTLVCLSSCGGGGSKSEGTTPITPPSAPSIGSFSAAPGTIMTGESASLSWSVTGATSLSINHNVGVVTGTHVTVNPTATTTYTLTATNSGGSRTAQTTVTVSSDPVGPSITTQPGNASVVTGQTATFTVEAYGTAPLTYAWRKNGTPIANTNAASYTTPATVDGDNSAKFSVVVSNSVDSVTSSEATLSVRAPGSVAGVLPAGMPSHLAVGLFEDMYETWMKNSGVAWDARYRYLVKGWVNNWGNGDYDGSWGKSYLEECDAQGFLPVVQYYQGAFDDAGNYLEASFYERTKNATFMKGYFGDFKLLMQRAKEFGKPVLVLMEADGFGYMERQSGDNPDAYSAIAASGMTELQGLPNTAAGWGLAFLQIRKSVGASNVILGMHVSGWATLNDIAYYQSTIPLEPEVAKAYAFLSKLGLADNVTGETYDVLVGDPLDRDSGYYEVVQGLGQDRWWDASDNASINSKSFNRYAEWLRIWNQTAQKRWVLWQIPLGNSNHLNVANNDGSRQGYKDNRAEYFFGAGDTVHMQKFVDVGVIALLFGRGEGSQSTYTNDYYTDGQLFMKSRAGAILNAEQQPPLAP